MTLYLRIALSFLFFNSSLLFSFDEYECKTERIYIYDTLFICKTDTIFLRINKSDTNYILLKLQNADKSPEIILKDVIVPIVSILALLATIFTLYFNKRFKNYDFLAGIDSMIVKDPELWGIYDNQRREFVKIYKGSLYEYKQKLKAFSYYILNNFEMVLSKYFFWDYWRKSKVKDAWEAYFVDLYIKSNIFSECVDLAIEDFGFSEKHRKEIKRLKDIAEILKDTEEFKAHYKSPGDANLMKSYSVKAEEILRKNQSKNCIGCIVEIIVRFLRVLLIPIKWVCNIIIKVCYESLLQK